MIWSRWPLGAQPNGGDPPPIAQEIEMVVIDLNTMEILPKTYTGHKGFTDSTVGQKNIFKGRGYTLPYDFQTCFNRSKTFKSCRAWPIVAHAPNRAHDNTFGLINGWESDRVHSTSTWTPVLSLWAVAVKIIRQGCGTGQCSKPCKTLPFAPLTPKNIKRLILTIMTKLCNINYAHMQCVNTPSVSTALPSPFQIFKCPPPNPHELSFPLLILMCSPFPS